MYTNLLIQHSVTSPCCKAESDKNFAVIEINESHALTKIHATV